MIDGTGSRTSRARKLPGTCLFSVSTLKNPEQVYETVRERGCRWPLDCESDFDDFRPNIEKSLSCLITLVRRFSRRSVLPMNLL